MHLSASGVGQRQILAALPACIQPFLGAWSDMFTLFGCHRRSFYVLGVVVDVIGYLCLAFLPNYHYLTVVALVAITGTGAIMIWVMVRAVMVAIGNLTGTIGRLQSLPHVLPHILTLTSTAKLTAIVVQHWSYRTTFLAAAGVAFPRFPLAWIMDEKRVVATRHATETLDEHRERIEARDGRRADQAAKLRKALLSPGIWAIAGYTFYLIITPGLNTAQIFYETDVLHFSKYFIGKLDMFNAAGLLVGPALFALTSRRITMRAMVWGAWAMDCLSYVAQICLHNEFSAKVVMFTLGLIGSHYTLCLWSLTARARARGIESTVYALVMAAAALAGTLSELLGGPLYDYFGPTHHFTIQHGWIWGVSAGFLFTVPAAILIPFRPALARSRERLGTIRDDEE